MTEDVEDIQTSFERAVQHGNCSQVQALLQKGALVNSPNLSITRSSTTAEKAIDADKGDTPLHVATRLENIEMVRILLDGLADVNCSNRGGFTPLHIAAATEQEDIVRTLLIFGAEVNATSRICGETPLHLATEHGNPELVTLLLDRGGDIQATDCWKQQPIHKAALHGNCEVVTLLLDRGANMHGKDNWGQQPLHVAAENGQKEAVKLLLKLGANRYVVDGTWRNPLQGALDSNQVRAIETLLTFIPCATQRDNYDLIALLEEKIHMVQPDAVEVLLKMIPRLPVFIDPLIFSTIETLFLTETFGSPSSRMEAQCLTDSCTRLLDILLKRCLCSVNTLNLEGDTPLHEAMRMCYKCQQLTKRGRSLKIHCGDNIVRKLLEFGANVNQANIEGETPLMIAAKLGCDHFIKVLIDLTQNRGIELLLDQRNYEGRTALLIAVEHHEVGVVKLLVENGASVHAYDNHGFTVLHGVHFDIDNQFRSDYSYFIDPGKPVKRKVNTDLTLEKFHKWLRKKSESRLKFEKLKPIVKRNIEKIIFHWHKKEAQNLLNFVDFAGNKPRDYTGKSFVIDTMERTPLHRLFIAFVSGTSTETVITRKKKHGMLNDKTECLQQRRGNIENLAQMKDCRGRTTFHYAVMKVFDEDDDDDDVALWMDILSDLASSINAVDKYGRTPLHYAADDEIYVWLVDHGADEKIMDDRGYTPKYLKELRSVMLQLPNADIPKFKPVTMANVSTVWQVYTSLIKRQRLIRRLDKITAELKRFVDRLASAISARDYRFTCFSSLVGSASDGTKTKIPGDFDFNMTLTELSKRCEVHPSLGAPPGYVHIKRKGYGSKQIVYKRKDDFDILFNEEQLLLANEVNSRFLILVQEVLQDRNFWKNDESFELCIIYDSDQNVNSLHRCVELQMIHPIKDEDGELYFDNLSLDIVPCIHFENYWPNEALDSVKDEIKSFGCNLVFDSPHSNCPWVPFAETYARISFSLVERHIMKNSSTLLNAAYLVTKEMGAASTLPKGNEPYLLKSSFLYCIEAFDNPEHARDSSELCQDSAGELFTLVERILFCFAEFSDLDFMPCYMMPQFAIPIFQRLKSRHMHSYLLNRTGETFISRAHEWYMKIFQNSSETVFSNSAIQPIGENFDRESFMRRLRMMTSQ